ncbi:MAG TPA: urease accessory UreF family protein [Nitrospira sp.]|nr:urease accessory UreF family protein [Nitrospira sp.]
MDTRALLEGLRFTDTFFPSGGYAFSSGLEAAMQGGAVKDSDQLGRYVEDLLRGGMSRREVLAAKVANRAGMTGVVAKAIEVDRDLEATKIGREARVASRQMGRQILKIATDQLRDKPVVGAYRDAVEAGAPGHLAVSFGLTLGTCGWTAQETAAAFLYHTAVGFVSAAMRLSPLGQFEGQRVLGEWLPLIDQISREVDETMPMSSWSPIQDIYAMRHGRLEWRLFRS